MALALGYRLSRIPVAKAPAPEPETNDFEDLYEDQAA
jgi:hypothetical protein